MRYLLFTSLLLLHLLVDAQEIKFRYKDRDATMKGPFTITKETKEISTEKAPTLRIIQVEAANLPANYKILIHDFSETKIGEWKNGDGEAIYTATTNLNNQPLKFYLIDDKGTKTVFATVYLLDKLPNSTIDVLKKATATLNAFGGPCAPCKYENNAIEYDFKTNTIGYQKGHKTWLKGLFNGRAIVGKPFTFSVKNINPFRDSVIISHETANYNTDIPDLFTKAFFAVTQHGEGSKMKDLLADVLELGEQIEKLMAAIKDSKECDDICTIIQQVKKDVDAHFISTYKLDPQKDFAIQVLDRLQGIAEVYKPKVLSILNRYRAFYNARNYVNYQIPQVQNVDAYKFNLSILAKSGAQLATTVDHQPILTRTVGGVKFDFSTGLFVTKLTDEQYAFRPDSTVIRNQFGGDSIVFNRRNQIVRQGNERDFGVAALMHFYPRISPSVNLALSLGAGLSIGPNPSIRYLGGGTLLLGREGRLGITAGWAGGFVDVLAEGYQNGDYVATGDLKAITKKTFQTKSFFALSFNIPLFKTKVDTAATPAEEKNQETTTEAKTEETKK